MKRRLFSTLLPIMALISPLFAQQAPALYLTGYTYAQEHRAIGAIKERSNTQLTALRLSGPDASFFEIQGNTLQLKQLKPSAAYMEVTIQANTGKQRLEKTFRLLKAEFIRNKVIAHRGAFKNTHVPENSLAALNHAVRLGCEGSEFDVQLSADSVIFVNHDDHIQGLTLAKTASKQLAALQLSNGEALPTLEAYLKEGMKQYKTKLILEIKPSILGTAHSLVLTEKVVNLVASLKAEAWVDYISFDHQVCKALLKLAPYARVSYLKGDKAPETLAAEGMYGLDYHYSVLQKNPEWIAEAKAKNLTINVWTVNDEAMMDWLLKENADFITTNEPELLLKKISGLQ